MYIPELLAPVGTWEQFEAALTYGAHAVYLGGEFLSLRTRGFSHNDVNLLLNTAHAHGVSVYYCLNAFPRGQHMEEVEARLDMLGESSVDALIIADPGVFRLARRICPHIPIHVSTQANTCNAESATFWHEQGAQRVNLARELSGREIRDIAQSYTSIEYECFVHGAQCMALSGKCLLSAALNKRPANLGQCTQPCRFAYRPVAVAVEEKERQTVLWEAWSGHDVEDYSSLWSPDDLCLVSSLRWFACLNIAAVKLEGRMRTAGYLAQVLDVYRTALDCLAAQQNLSPHRYEHELALASKRVLSSGFFLPKERRIQPLTGGTLVARIEERLSDACWRVSVRSLWAADQPICIMQTGLHRPQLNPTQYALENHRGERCTAVHSGTNALLHCDAPELQKGLYLRLA